MKARSRMRVTSMMYALGTSAAFAMSINFPITRYDRKCGVASYDNGLETSLPKVNVLGT